VNKNTEINAELSQAKGEATLPKHRAAGCRVKRAMQTLAVLRDRRDDRSAYSVSQAADEMDRRWSTCFIGEASPAGASVTAPSRS